MECSTISNDKERRGFSGGHDNSGNDGHEGNPKVKDEGKYKYQYNGDLEGEPKSVGEHN